MKKNLLILGAGGHGRCCLDIARASGLYGKISFLDDAAVGSRINDAQIIDSLEALARYDEEYSDVFVAIGHGLTRAKLMKKAEDLGYEIVSLISKECHVSPYATLEKGIVLFPGAVVEANAIVGEGAIVAANATINHDARLEAYSLVNSNSVIRPNAIVKKYAMVGSHCVISFGNIVEQEEKVPDGAVR